MLFKIIHGAQAVLKVKGGVYKQVDLYEYGPRLYAKHGAGYIGLRVDAMTTAPNVTWEHIEGTDYHPGEGVNWGALLVGTKAAQPARAA